MSSRVWGVAVASLGKGSFTPHCPVVEKPAVWGPCGIQGDVYWGAPEAQLVSETHEIQRTGTVLPFRR